MSGRRTYVDIFTRLINNANEDDEDFDPIPDYSFHDLNLKFNFDLSSKDKLFVSSYYGRDFFRFQGDGFDFNFDWGNTSLTFRWNHIFSPKLFSNTTATISDYNYLIQNELQNVASFELGSGIRDYNVKTDFFYSPTNQHNIRFGIGATFHQFEIGRLEGGDEEGTFSFEAGQNFTASEFAAYLSDDFEVNDRIKLMAGLRFSGFQNNEFYAAIEPRFSSRFSLSDKVSLKASYTHMAQFIHLVSNSAISLPTDLWYPSDQVVAPQRSNQIAAGAVWSISDDLLFSSEAYYKWSNNQVDFRDGADLFINDELNEEFVFGDGWSYGNEWYLEKTKGKLTGWAGYTLSWARRQFDEINEGKSFAPRFDTRHDISLVAIWELNRRLSFTAT
ncbi:MAG: TonB-dependent receptor, partial [Bacteroidota bacterium]